MSSEQKTLFKNIGKTNSWEEEWQDMPEYNNIKEEPPVITATFKFRTEEDFEEFKTIIKEHLFQGEKPFDGTQREEAKTSWYPHKEKASKYEYR